MVRNKEKDLGKAVWADQVALFLQSLCFTTELVALRLTTSSRVTIADIVVI